MTLSEEVKVDKLYVERRIRDWKKRISNLYITIKDWTKQSEYSIKIGGKLTMYEEQMAKFNVQPVQLDTADLYRDDKIILTIKPKGLWIIGANGRIDILSSNGSYMLIDTAEPFKTPKWKLYNGEKKNGVDLTKPSFFHLLK